MDSIDDGILAEIFRKLDPTDVMTVRAVSRRFRNIATAPDFRKDGSVAILQLRALSVAWSPDGHWLAYGGKKSDDTGLVGVWCHKRNTHLTQRASKIVESVCWSPDSTQLAFSLYFDSVLIWSRDQSGSHLTELQGHQGRIESPAWSRDGTRIACISQERMLNVWNVADSKMVQTIDVGARASIACAVRWDWSGGEGVATQGGGRRTDTRDGQPIHDVGKVEGTSGFSMGRKGLDGYRNVEEDRCHGTHSDQREGQGDRRQGDREFRNWRLAVGCDDAIIVYDSNDGLHWTYVKKLDVPSTVNVLAWNPAADGIICGGHRFVDDIMVCDVSSGTVVATLEDQPFRLCWSPCGRRIAAGSEYTVRVWEVPMGRENVQVTQPLETLELDEDPPGLDYSPDGNWIAIGAGNELRLRAAPR